MSDHKTYVIVGSSAAGVGALLKLRQLDPLARIICITAESHLPYNKCFLADYVSGLLTEDQLFLLTEQRINELNIDLVLNTRVTGIDRFNKKVITDTNKEISYDTLLLTLGSSPFIPPIEGAHGAGIFTFHTLADIEHIFRFCDERKVEHIIVIGGGITGLECADAFHNRGAKVSIIERGVRLLPHLMSAEQSNALALSMQERGATLYLNEQTAQIEHSHGVVSAVQTQSGISIPTQLVIIATGVRGNTELAVTAGLATGPQGVIVNDFFATNDPFIFAAGDMIQTHDQLSGHTVPTRLWPDAMNQGMRAAMAMVGGLTKSYQGVIPLVKSHFFGLDYLSLGWNSCQSNEIIFCATETYSSAVQVTDGTVTGVSVLGKGFNIGLCRQAVLTKMALADFCHSAGH